MDKLPTIWPLQPHTAAKHKILRRYLGAWYPKLSWTKRVLFIDGFAGPGRYSAGEPGSPVIAVDAAVSHRYDMSDCQFVYLFVEADAKRHASLVSTIADLSVPDNVIIDTRLGEFADTLETLLDEMDEDSHNLAPSFVMVDPFGFAGVPMSLISRLSQHPRLEVLISFMYESVNRFVEVDSVEHRMDELFGCPDWREINALETPAERKAFLLGLYEKQLRDFAEFEFVRSFEMLDDGGRTEYFLVFGTNHLSGMESIKDAMWAVDPLGGSRFSDADDTSQFALFDAPDLSVLEEQIAERFGSQPVSVGEIEDFVTAETDFKKSHLRKGVLKPLEQEELLEVVRSSRKRRFSYPEGTVIRFTKRSGSSSQ